jgi:hypothetical protein
VRSGRFGSVAVAQGSIGFAVGALGGVLVLLARDLDLPTGRLDWLASGFGGGLVLVAVLGSAVLRRGSDPVLRAGAGGLAAGLLGLALAPSPAVAVAGSLALGLGGALITLVSPVILSGPTAPALLSRATGIASVSGICAPLLLSAVDAAGPPGRLALLLPVPALAVLVVRGVRTGPADRDAGGSAEPAVVAPAGRFGGVRAVVEVARRWLRVVLAVSVEFALLVWAAARLQEVGLTSALAAGAAVSFAAGMAAGRLGAGPLLRRGVPVAIVGTVLAAVGTTMVAAGPAPGLVAAGLLLAGTGLGPQYPLALAEVMGSPGLAASRAAALGALASGTAILGSPAAVGAVGRAAGLATAYWLVLPVLALLAVLVALEHWSGPATLRPIGAV